MALRLAGKHCAIVGATGTIGSSIAQAFSSQGAVLTLLGRTALEAQGTLGPQLTPYQPPSSSPDTSADRPSEHRFIKLDAASNKSMEEVFANGAKDEVVGPVDILINCAGISQTTILKRTSYDVIDQILKTNLTATMMACKLAKLQEKGCIINVSSLMATKPAAGAAVYAAAKAGVIGLTSALCLELAPRSIRVNALLPGWVESPMWDQLRPNLKEKYLSSTPSRRVAKPAEVADAAVFLASNGFANNCVLNLDGGLSAA